jgi:hypothetical protein
MFDLSSTILALKLGLHETNVILISLASTLGLSLVYGLVLVKILSIVSAGLILLYAVRSSSPQMVRVSLFALACFAGIFAFAAVNNFVAIATIHLSL